MCRIIDFNFPNKLIENIIVKLLRILDINLYWISIKKRNTIEFVDKLIETWFKFCFMLLFFIINRKYINNLLNYLTKNLSNKQKIKTKHRQKFWAKCPFKIADNFGGQLVKRNNARIICALLFNQFIYKLNFKF